MSRLMKFFILSSALLVSQAVNAEAPSGKFTGYLSIAEGVEITCTVEIDISGNMGSITATPGDSVCGSHTFYHSPYNITYSGSTVTFHNVELWAFFNICYGDLVAEWNGADLDFYDVVLPNKTVGPNCILSGILFPVEGIS